MMGDDESSSSSSIDDEVPSPQNDVDTDNEERFEEKTLIEENAMLYAELTKATNQLTDRSLAGHDVGHAAKGSLVGKPFNKNMAENSRLLQEENDLLNEQIARMRTSLQKAEIEINTAARENVELSTALARRSEQVVRLQHQVEDLLTQGITPKTTNTTNQQEQQQPPQSRGGGGGQPPSPTKPVSTQDHFEIKAALDEAASKAILSEQRRLQAETVINQKDDDLRDVQVALVDADQQIQLSVDQNEALRIEIDQLHQNLRDAQQRELTSYTQVQEMMDLLEEARLERDQAAQGRDRMKQELVDLEEKMINVTKMSRGDIDHEKLESKERENKAVADIHAEVVALQQQNEDMKEAVDKALRAKRIVERELDKRSRAPDEDSVGLQALVEQLRGQLMSLQRHSDNNEVQASLFRSRNEQAEKDLTQIRMEKEFQMSEFERRKLLLEQECSDIKAMAARYEQELAEQFRRSRGSDQECKRLKADHSMEMALLTRRNEAKCNELEGKALEVEGSRRQATESLHRLLTEHQRKFVHFEEDTRIQIQTLKENLRSCMQDLKHKVEDNDKLFQVNEDNKTALLASSKRLDVTIKQLMQLEHDLKTSERRADVAEATVSDVIGKQEELIDELREVRGLRDKALLELAASQRLASRLTKQVKEAELSVQQSTAVARQLQMIAN